MLLLFQQMRIELFCCCIFAIKIPIPLMGFRLQWIYFFFFFFSLIELVFTSAVWEFCQHINSSFQCIHRCVQYKERNGFITWQKNGCSFRLVSLFTPSFLFSSLFPLFNYIVIGCFFLITTGASKLLLFLKPYCMKHAMFSTNHYTSSLFYYISNLHEKQIVEPDQ